MRPKPLYREGDAPAAARLAKKATTLDPGHAPSLALLGTIYWESKQFSDALYYFGSARKALPKEPGLIYNCALAHASLGHLAEAIQEFDLFLRATRSGSKTKWGEMREIARADINVLRTKLSEPERKAALLPPNPRPRPSRESAPAATPHAAAAGPSRGRRVSSSQTARVPRRRQPPELRITCCANGCNSCAWRRASKT